MSLKEKVAANFNTAKADAILEKAGVEDEPVQNTISQKKQTYWFFVPVVELVDFLPML